MTFWQLLERADDVADHLERIMRLLGLGKGSGGDGQQETVRRLVLPLLESADAREKYPFLFAAINHRNPILRQRVENAFFDDAAVHLFGKSSGKRKKPEESAKDNMRDFGIL